MYLKVTDIGSKVTEGKDFKTEQTEVVTDNLMKVRKVNGAEIDTEVSVEKKV